MINEAILALIPICAPDVAPNTIAQIMRVESQGNPLAINVNGINKKFSPANIAEAVAITQEYIKKGYTVDVGLMQINSSNFSQLGYANRIDAIFEACNNIAAGASVLKNFYRQSRKKSKDKQVALKGAISAYNTGSFEKGFKNGYVSAVYAETPIQSQQPQDALLNQALNAKTTVNIDAIKLVYQE